VGVGIDETRQDHPTAHIDLFCFPGIRMLLDVRSFSRRGNPAAPDQYGSAGDDLQTRKRLTPARIPSS